MKKTAVAVLIMLVTAGGVYAKGYEVQKKAGEYDVMVAIDRNPPIAGDNAVSITVKDSTGKPVKDARVTVEYSMPPMMGMAPMNYKTDALLQGDEYRTVMGLSMSGSWNISVKIVRAGKTSSMRFTVDAK
jgi:hypothetical protein